MLIHRSHIDNLLGKKLKRQLIDVCHLCGQVIDTSELTWDHVVCKSQGGKHGLNLLPAHGKCNWNRSDGGLSPEQRLRARYHQLFLIAYALTEIK